MNRTSQVISGEDARALRAGLRPYKLRELSRDEETDFLLDNIDARLNPQTLLPQLKTGEYFDIKSCRFQEGTKPLENYLERLRKEDFDIDHGNAMYGFRMIESNDKKRRILRIFRRHS